MANMAKVQGGGASFLGADPVEQTGIIVRDNETAIRGDHHPRRSPPAVPTGILPSGDEIARRDRGSVLEVDQQQLRRGRWLPVPGAMLGDDEVAIEIARNSLPFEKRKSKRCGVGLDADRWRGYVRTIRS